MSISPTLLLLYCSKKNLTTVCSQKWSKNAFETLGHSGDFKGFMTRLSEYFKAEKNTPFEACVFRQVTQEQDESIYVFVTTRLKEIARMWT